MTDTGATHELPAGMRSVAMDAHGQHAVTVVDYPGVGDHYGWCCSCGAEDAARMEWGAAADAAREHAGQSVLAAALATCHIREEWRARITYSDGSTGHTVWYVSRDGAQRSAEHERQRHYATAVTIERRLVIETEPLDDDQLTRH